MSSSPATRLHAASLARKRQRRTRVSCYARRRLRGHTASPIWILNSALTDAGLQLFVDACTRTGDDWRWVGSRAVAECFGDVGGANLCPIVEVGDCARNF